MENTLAHIAYGATTLTFVIEDEFEQALKKLRQVLGENRLDVIVELDAAKRVRTAFNINVSPCKVLLVDNLMFLLEVTAIDRAAAVFIPFHVVVSGSGVRTLVHVLNRHSIQLAGLSIGARTALIRLEGQLLRAVSTIGDLRAGDLTDHGEARRQELDVA
jgi:uncharacterized protein (DUF302 family)